jgi:hypothetical protein
MKFEIPVPSKMTVGWTEDLLLKRLGSALEWLLQMTFCPAHAQLIRDIVKEHTRLACIPSDVEAWLARTGRKPTSFPPMFELSSTGRTYTRDAYAPVRRDAYAEVEKLTGGSIPTPFHFSNFEESFLDRSVAIRNPRHGPSLFEVPNQNFAIRNLHFQKPP